MYRYAGLVGRVQRFGIIHTFRLRQTPWYWSKKVRKKKRQGERKTILSHLGHSTCSSTHWTGRRAWSKLVLCLCCSCDPSHSQEPLQKWATCLSVSLTPKSKCFLHNIALIAGQPLYLVLSQRNHDLFPHWQEPTTLDLVTLAFNMAPSSGFPRRIHTQFLLGLTL